ncbi:adenylyltransferase/cytidyltransferase family protein [Sulfitobacter geojensis]|uniref:ethanolamine-phosphate cytidylyltransferase n=1 Tax=Sulfitobacter geojensis TaxID=1342299 RepID=A0AAE2VVU0_9RHOB|nr:adenylyltransferase/cytidyltransferase family protein [Sulfitobacter geojensis]MBM1688328.1 adenylyltransferase/cytidyltransferase family protein [Sulfitobacter geojensis]MBM1692395.1 adenylyltransferase/cytidyltransferase family protein [Sulfitobacter geojensis]MBM1704561.1 adenylyltransferase/cytidyltransferase family protein [Sulfitobacter geojensis]MBM1708619.1 adenylyltransferase/cytidyltransferase family protein [Sulfitobacter geojensis]MBM1712684.1 adenylyltransferase/cytidyltransfer
MRGRPARVMLTYGRFDMLHQDHLRFLRQISAMGHELIVGCASDALAAQSGYPCARSFEERRGMLESCRFVSRVIAETDPNQKRTDIVNYNVSAIVLGKYQYGQLDHLQDIAQIVYLPRLAPRKIREFVKFS